MIVKRLPSRSTIALPDGIRWSTRISALGEAHASINVLPWRIPQPSKHCAYVRRSSNPCQQGQHTVNFHPPCHALYFRPLSLRTRRISHCRQTKSASHPCLFLDVPDTTQIRKKHAMFSQSVADSRASERALPALPCSQGTRKLSGSAVPFLPAQPTAPPAISALQGT